MDPLKLNEYQLLAKDTDRISTDVDGLRTLLLGLFGEAGSLLSSLKKSKRDGNDFPNFQAVQEEELGDCLWYLTAICRRLEIGLEEVALDVIKNSFDSKVSRLPAPLSFRDFQAIATAAAVLTQTTIEADLFALGSTAGQFLEIAKDGNPTVEKLKVPLSDMLAAIAKAAAVKDIPLNQVALNNLQKNSSRWPTEKIYREPFDSVFDENEQLPRQIEIEFIEKNVAGKTYVLQRCKGINIGDRLTDNKIENDDYRFHDVFHLAYAVHLGWSPVMRALFKVKRKSDPKTDEVQDGARAILIEEGISTVVFTRALGLGLFEQTHPDYDLLKLVQEFVKGFEVDQCPMWQWNEAITDGFRVFRDLKRERKGVVKADLINHTLTFELIAGRS